MKRNIKIYENPILYLLILIVGIGTVMMYSASSIVAINIHNEYSFYIQRHLIRLSISIIALLVIYNINFKWFKKFSFEILILSWIIMIAAYFFNDNTATKRWLILFGKNIFTTSDFARIALIIFTANFIDNNKKKINQISLLVKSYFPFLLITLLLILFQPDLSTTSATVLIITTMLIISGLKLKNLLLPFISCLLIVIIKVLNTPYQYARFIKWWNFRCWIWKKYY